MTESASDAAKGTTVLMTQSIASGIFRILNLAVLTRLLLQSQMGEIAILGIIFGFMQFLGALGLNHASPLIIPEQEDAGNLGAIKSFLKRGSAIILVSSSCMALFVFLLIPVLFVGSPVSSDLILLVLIIGPFSSMEVFLDSFLLGRYEVRKLASGRIAFDIARVTATIYLVVLGMGISGVMFGWLIGEFVAVCVFGAAAFHKLDAKSTAIRMSPILAFGLPNLVFQTVDVTIQNTDRIILGYLTDLSALGVYDVMLRFLYMFSLVSLAVATSLYPILTRVRLDMEQSESGIEGLGNAVSILIRYIVLVLLPVSVVVAFNSHTVLSVLFGSYANAPDASLSFSLLVVTYALWGVVYAFHTVLRSMGEAKFFILSGLGIIVFEIVGCWYLTSIMGILGTAIIRSMYVILLFLSSLIRLRQKGVRKFPGITKSVLRISISSLIPALFVLLLAPQGFLDLAIFLLLAALIYIVFLFVGREITPLDFRLARSVVPAALSGIIDRVERVYLGKSDDVQS